MHEPEQSASNELFQQALAKPGQNIFNLKLQCPPGRRMQQWHPKDFWENITMLSRDPLTLNNFHLSWRPEPRQNFKSLHDKQQSRWEFSFTQRFMAWSHRTEQYGKVMVKLNYINSRWNYITCTFKITPGGGTPTWNRRGCSSEILNLTPKGDHLGVAQAFCDP